MESFFFCLTSSCLILHLVLGGFPRTPPPSASGSWHLQGPLLLLPLHLLIDQILVWNSLMLLQSLSCYFLLPLGSVLSCSHSHSPSASFSNTKIPLSNPNLSPDKYSELHRFHPNLKYFSIVFFFFLLHRCPTQCWIMRRPRFRTWRGIPEAASLVPAGVRAAPWPPVTPVRCLCLPGGSSQPSETADSRQQNRVLSLSAERCLGSSGYSAHWRSFSYRHQLSTSFKENSFFVWRRKSGAPQEASRRHNIQRVFPALLPAHLPTELPSERWLGDLRSPFCWSVLWAVINSS